MAEYPVPPDAHRQFSERFPQIVEAWSRLGRAGDEGPLDERTARLVKLGVAIGAMREGAVHSSVRKAKAMGISREEIEQVVAVAAAIMGLPALVAAWTWIEDLLEE